MVTSKRSSSSGQAQGRKRSQSTADRARQREVAGLEAVSEAELDSAAEDFGVASALGGLAATELAEGAADLTRGVDLTITADRVGRLSEVVAAAGSRDIAQGV